MSVVKIQPPKMKLIKKDTLTSKPPTFIEVCAGAGGLSTGLINAGFVPLLLNDNNHDCCQTLEDNHGYHQNANIICCSMNDLSTHLDKYKNTVDLLTGGVPCQSFSQAGSRKGLNDPRGDLMLKFADLIDLLQPKIFMIENVKGLLTHNHGQTIQTIITNLNRNDMYNVKYEVLNAVNYDVPQKRERVFIIGVMKKYNVEFEYPLGNTKIKTLGDILINVPLSNIAQYSDEKKKLFDMIPQGGCWVNLPIELQKSYMGKSFLSGGGKRGILHRLSMSKPSLTILCTPTQKQTERCHPLESRPLTLRESARIQTFPDDYTFSGTIASQYKQIGNAVPVQLAYHVGLALKTTLEKMK